MNQGESGAASAVDPAADYVEQGVVTETPVSPAPSPAPDPAKTPAESPEDDTDGSEAAKKPRRGGFQKKLERANAEIEALRAQLATKPSEKPPAQAEKPKPDDYPSYDAYIEALTEHKAEQAAEKRIKERDSQSQEQQFRKEMQDKQAAYERSQDEARKLYSDYDDVIEAYDGPLTLPMEQALLDSDMKAELAYYLAKNPDEAEKLAGMNLIGLNRAIGRIEAKIEGSKGQKAAVKVTQAPPPIDPVKPTSTSTGNADPRGYVEL